METYRVDPEQVGEHSGQKMLSGMLLHVIESAGPIDRAFYFKRRNRRGENVNNSISLVYHIFEGNTVDRAAIVRLSAGRWIKGSAVEDQPASSLTGCRDIGAEGRLVRVRVIKSLRAVTQ